MVWFMALAANALTSLASLQAHMHRYQPDVDLLRIYHNGASGATAATVEVTSADLKLKITGGSQAGTVSITLANKTIAALIADIVLAYAVGQNPWISSAIGSGASSAQQLRLLTEVSAYLSAAEQFLRGVDTYAMEQAINSASAIMERYCARVFKSASYRQLYHGTDTPGLRLRQYPVTAVSRVAIEPVNALKVDNSSTDAKDATVANDGTNVALVVIGGVNAVSTNAAIGSNTITQLAVLINAVGKGFTATVEPNAGSWPATELFKSPAQGCLGFGVSLLVPGKSESATRMESSSGILRRDNYRFPTFAGHDYPIRTEFETAPGARWPRGLFNICVSYTAGFSTTPYDLELLCNELSANLLRAGARDGNLTSESGDGYSGTATGQGYFPESLRRRADIWKAAQPIPEYMDV